MNFLKEVTEIVKHDNSATDYVQPYSIQILRFPKELGICGAPLTITWFDLKVMLVWGIKILQQT